jgi:signal recognition particle subunit SRP54
VFDALSEKLQGVFRSLRGEGTLKESHVDEALRQIRMALLEADVHFKVVKDFLERVRARAIGQDVLKSLTPGQAVVRVVRDEMIAMLGVAGGGRLQTSSKLPSIVLMTGLQGSGKTTTTAKLARWLQKGGHSALLVSTDVYRPAAREQLKTLALGSGLSVHHPAALDKPEDIVRSAIDEAKARGHEFLLVDTAGRLHIDDELMDELTRLKGLTQPTEILYVADSMTGQDAVRSASEFHRRVGITGVVLTKMDGDARGGAALSTAAVTGCPVKFAGTGEKAEAFEAFDPERMVGRLLGMGDVLGLIERAEEAFDAEQAEKAAQRFLRNEFTLEDFREQITQLRKMGPLDQVLSMIPGLNQSQMKNVDMDAGEREIKRNAAIIDSMTLRERRDPQIINGSRRKRIAKGSGTAVEDVNRLLKQYAQARKMMKSLGGGGKAMKRLASRFAHLR